MCILHRFVSCYTIAEIFHIPHLLWAIIICTGDCCLRLFITLGFPIMYIPQHVPVSISLPTMLYSTFSSLCNSKRSFVFCKVRITCLPILKSPKLSRVSLVKYSLYSVIHVKSVTKSDLLQILLLPVSHWFNFLNIFSRL